MKTTLLIALTIFHQLSSSTATKDPSIIIVGAGVSGLTAGKILIDHGFHNLTILEAENRIGGRIHSVFFGDAFIDLGASFCHGQKNNIVYNTVEKLDLLVHSKNSTALYSSSGDAVDPAFVDEFFNITSSLLTESGDLPTPDNENISYGEYYTKYYTEIINERFGKDPAKLKLAQEGLDLLEKWAEGSDGFPSWFDGPAATDYQWNEGDEYMEWKGTGYQTFIYVLLRKFPDLQRVTAVERGVVFDKEVAKIAYDASRERGGVTVTCSDGSVYEADHVIVTPSLGVIKENLDEMFEPQLPLAKRTAIDSIGFGAIMSLATHYTGKWWGDDFAGVSLLWTKEDLENSAKEFPLGPHHNNRSWVTYTAEIMPCTRNPNVLRFWFNGVLVPEIELLSDEVLVDGVDFITRKFLGKDYNVTKPDKMIHSRWVANPHFKGTYSYQKIAAVRRGNGTNAEEELAKPIKTESGRPFVHFAGEATHPRYYSNVQGATETGIREALSIINYYSKH
ncbi:unnamed protein product [Phyllotreta striolata]|uniref:Amine oxidase n=1 Tax=Phyllotreta striolata TaxID=444603 RepID=A0A9N9XQS6_PHYSR|nr:unnamed protein product [Phyllotreta striolata]